MAVLDKGKTIATGTGGIDGTGTVTFELPAVAPGEYEVRVAGNGFSKTTAVQIQAGTLLFLETDKPIYKPGQTIQVRLVALDSELKPVQTEATVEIQDAKGIKIFKQTLTTDEYGTVTTELPLSPSPTWGSGSSRPTRATRPPNSTCGWRSTCCPSTRSPPSWPRIGSWWTRPSPAT